ncbi:hypothetical protein BG004_001595 [Podila humilis]|nr:hypothetical protein BG004_001595 [Podila humilis]
MTDINQLPAPYSQFTLFSGLRSSLYPHDWHNFVETWHSMVAVNAPISEFTYNLIPFFGNARKLQPVFQRYLKFAQQDSNFLSTMTTVLMSTPLLERTQGVLQSPRLFGGYVVALKMDDASASHNQVMNSIQAFLAPLPPHTRLAMQRIFAEAEASDSLGLTPSTQDTLFHLLHGDTQLYIDVLAALQLNQSRNLAWDVVVGKVKTLVLAKNPQAWADTEQFLERLHWGGYQDYDYNNGGGYVDEYDGDDWYEDDNEGYDNDDGGYYYGVQQQQQQQQQQQPHQQYQQYQPQESYSKDKKAPPAHGLAPPTPASKHDVSTQGIADSFSKLNVA